MIINLSKGLLINFFFVFFSVYMYYKNESNSNEQKNNTNDK